MKHTIVAPALVGTAEIVWDDGAGEVTGNHAKVAELALFLAEGRPTAHCPWGAVELRDPAHDPSDFLTALRYVVPMAMHIQLPESLAAVEPTPYPPAPGGGSWNGVLLPPDVIPPDPKVLPL